MKGGRLKIVNESRYPDDEIERLVRFGLSEIDLTGHRVVVAVKNARAGSPRRKNGVAYSGVAYSLNGGGIPRNLYNRYCGSRTYTHHLLIVRIGTPESFPAAAFWRRNGTPRDSYHTWEEAVVGVTAHEGKHAEHAHDGAYRTKSGRRMVKIPSRPLNGNVRTTERYKIVPVRVGVERIEPKCEAFESHMLRCYREQ